MWWGRVDGQRTGPSLCVILLLWGSEPFAFWSMWKLEVGDKWQMATLTDLSHPETRVRLRVLLVVMGSRSVMSVLCWDTYFRHYSASDGSKVLWSGLWWLLLTYKGRGRQNFGLDTEESALHINSAMNRLVSEDSEMACVCHSQTSTQCCSATETGVWMPLHNIQSHKPTSHYGRLLEAFDVLWRRPDTCFLGRTTLGGSLPAADTSCFTVLTGWLIHYQISL